MRRGEGGANIFGVFRVKKITILRQKILFFPIAEGGAKIFGVFRVKNHDSTPKNLIFSNFRGVRPPPLDPPLILLRICYNFILKCPVQPVCDFLNIPIPCVTM
jgi:hypothetical protein